MNAILSAIVRKTAVCFTAAAAVPTTLIGQVRLRSPAAPMTILPANRPPWNLTRTAAFFQMGWFDNDDMDGTHDGGSDHRHRVRAPGIGRSDLSDCDRGDSDAAQPGGHRPA